MIDFSSSTAMFLNRGYQNHGQSEYIHVVLTLFHSFLGNQRLKFPSHLRLTSIDPLKIKSFIQFDNFRNLSEQNQNLYLVL